MKLKNLLVVVASAAVVFGASGAYAGDKDKDKDKGEHVSPVPEPSSMLVFGAGLLVASQVARRKR